MALRRRSCLDLCCGSQRVWPTVHRDCYIYMLIGREDLPCVKVLADGHRGQHGHRRLLLLLNIRYHHLFKFIGLQRGLVHLASHHGTWQLQVWAVVLILAERVISIGRTALLNGLPIESEGHCAPIAFVAEILFLLGLIFLLPLHLITGNSCMLLG